MLYPIEWNKLPPRAIYIFSGGDAPNAVYTSKLDAEKLLDADDGSGTYVDVFPHGGGTQPLDSFLTKEGILSTDF